MLRSSTRRHARPRQLGRPGFRSVGTRRHRPARRLHRRARTPLSGNERQNDRVAIDSDRRGVGCDVQRPQVGVDSPRARHPRDSRRRSSWHDVAVREALTVFETNASGRRGHGGPEIVAGDGFVAAAFRHRTSRAGDPHLHRHVVVANLVRRPNDRWTALDARPLYRWSKSVGYLCLTCGSRRPRRCVCVGVAQRCSTMQEGRLTYDHLPFAKSSGRGWPPARTRLPRDP